MMVLQVGPYIRDRIAWSLTMARELRARAKMLRLQADEAERDAAIAEAHARLLAKDTQYEQEAVTVTAEQP